MREQKKKERKHHAAWVTNKQGTEGAKEVRNKQSKGRMIFSITRINKSEWEGKLLKIAE